ncbi:MAG: hypothetical protein GY778_03890, partial [bacterium]|nr:hypothetical protein [bacterium]
VRSLILDNVDPVASMQGITVTGGRLNAQKALADATANEPPVAVTDFYTMDQGTTVNIYFGALLTNDYDPDGDPIHITGPPGPLPNGVYCGVAPTGICYRPDADFVGELTIPYEISDGSAEDSGNIRITVVSAGCPWPLNHPHFCRDCGPCTAGEADCDNDAECQGALVCSHDVGTDYGLPWYYDVCECPWPANHANYCRDCGPCAAGEADCDNNAECLPGLVCSHNVGSNYGLPWYYDVCEAP